MEMLFVFSKRVPGFTRKNLPRASQDFPVAGFALQYCTTV